MTETVGADQVVERPLARQCAACGGPIELRDTGRPPTYCSNACRQKAWALRAAERALGTPADTRPTVVREVVERATVGTQVRTRTQYQYLTPARPPAAGADDVPNRAREWTEQLAALADQLRDPDSTLAREHWQHRRLYDGLVAAMAALGQAHPGGLDRLAGR